MNLSNFLTFPILAMLLMLNLTTYCDTGNVTFRQDGIMLIDGKPFFPIGAYRNFSSSNGALLKEAGFNMTHEYFFEYTNAKTAQIIEKARKFLKDANDNDLKVFMGLSRRAIKNGDVKEIEDYVAGLKDMPALTMWYLYDEPITRKISTDALDKAANIIRKVDPYHPISMVFNHIRRGVKAKPYTDIVDCVWVDPYPIGSLSKDPISAVGENIAIARNIVEDKKPVWSVIQCFQWEYFRGEMTLQKDGAPTIPTKRQLRYMNYLALASNAKGLIYYWAQESKYHIINDAPEVWANICDMVKELNALQAFLTACPDKELFNIPKGFKLWTRAAGEKRVFAIINYRDAVQRFKWMIPWKNEGSINSFPDNKKISLINGEFNMDFSPLEVKVFIIDNKQ